MAFIFADQILKFSHGPGYRNTQCIQAFLIFSWSFKYFFLLQKLKHTSEQRFSPIIKNCGLRYFMMLVKMN